MRACPLTSRPHTHTHTCSVDGPDTGFSPSRRISNATFDCERCAFFVSILRNERMLTQNGGEPVGFTMCIAGHTLAQLLSGAQKETHLCATSVPLQC